MPLLFPSLIVSCVCSLGEILFCQSQKRKRCQRPLTRRESASAPFPNFSSCITDISRTCISLTFYSSFLRPAQKKVLATSPRKGARASAPFLCVTNFSAAISLSSRSISLILLAPRALSSILRKKIPHFSQTVYAQHLTALRALSNGRCATRPAHLRQIKENTTLRSTLQSNRQIRRVKHNPEIFSRIFFDTPGPGPPRSTGAGPRRGSRGVGNEPGRCNSASTAVLARSAGIVI